MDITDFRFIRINEGYDFFPFDCEDEDLNNFLLEDARPFSSQLLAVTYILQSEDSTVAYLSLLNDKISLEDADNKVAWADHIRDQMPEGKRFRSYPAVKVGRLAVHKDFKKKGLGTILLDWVKETFVVNNRTGCKYITVDAYARSLSFYEKNGFMFLTEKDKKRDTRLMFFDLCPVKPAQQ